MNMQIRFDPSDPEALDNAASGTDATGSKWRVLHDSAAAVAELAGFPSEVAGPLRPDFPQAIMALGGWRRIQVEQALDDLVAVMEPGLEALLAVHQRGADGSTAARALVREFSAARNALLDLLGYPPGEQTGLG